MFDPDTRALKLDLFPFGPTFTGGINVAVGGVDVNHDGVPDIVAGVASGGGPRVVVLDGTTGAALRSFFAFEPSFTGGVTVASGAVGLGGAPAIIAGAGPTGAPLVAVLDPDTGAAVRQILAYDPAFRGGVYVAAGSPDFVTGGTQAEPVILTGAGPGGGPHVKEFSGTTGAQILSLFAFDPLFRGGALLQNASLAAIFDTDR